MMNKKEINKLKEYFSDKKNIEIKKELLQQIHTKTHNVCDMSEIKLDKLTKLIRYYLMVYDLSCDMNKKLKEI